MLRGLRTSCRVATGAVRSNSTIAGTLYYRCAFHEGDRTALVVPHEKVKWTYKEFWDNVQRVAGGLKKMGYHSGQVIASDMGNSVANLVLHMAVAHNGMQVLTVKNKEELDALTEQVFVDGAVMSSGASFLSKASFPNSSLEASAFAQLAGPVSEGATDRMANLAYYSSPNPVTNREVYLYGVGTAGTLEIKPDDQVCIGVSLNHPFGMGSVISAIVRNATVHLPDLSKPELGDSTILMTDTHKLAALRDAAKGGSKLRGGIVKVGSGYDLLNEKEKVGDAELWTLGSGEEVFRPLFDACVNTYYPYK